MKIKLIGKNITVTEGIKNKVEEKLSMLNKYSLIDDNTIASVLVRTYPTNQKIEVTIPTKFAILRSEVVHKDLYAAIDITVDKLEDQIRRQKTRLEKRKKFNLSEKFSYKDDFVDSDIDDEFFEDEELVRTKNIDIDNIELDEAIMKMEMLGHNFYIYKDNEDDKVSVVYKRNDNGYGLIEVDNI